MRVLGRFACVSLPGRLKLKLPNIDAIVVLDRQFDHSGCLSAGLQLHQLLHIQPGQSAANVAKQPLLSYVLLLAGGRWGSWLGGKLPGEVGRFARAQCALVGAVALIAW
jgi:hypothetical protein